MLTSSLSRARGRPARLLAALAVAATFTGCQILPEAQPDPTRYFVLSSPLQLEGSQPSEHGVTVGLRTIELPGYLRNTRTLVVAHGSNEMEFREYDRWAEPLESGLARVLRDSLVHSERINRVVTFPFGLDQARRFDLAVRVVHCEGVESDQGQTVRFVLAYDILDGASGEVLKHGTYVAPEESWNGQPGALAAALGRAATAAGQALAAELPE